MTNARINDALMREGAQKIEELRAENNRLRDVLRALVSDVQAMRCGLPDAEVDWTAETERGLFGPFEDIYVETQCYTAIINWPNLGITLAEAQALLGDIERGQT